METRANYTVVGAFVLLVIAAMGGFAVWLAKLDVDQSKDVYEIVFTGSVSGLQLGGQVRYRGIPVGRISDIRIDPTNTEQVLVTAELRPDTPVKKDTVASLELLGITGLSAIQLLGGTRDSPLLEPDASGKPPRIEGLPSSLQRLVDDLPRILKSSVTLLDRVTTVFSDENVTALGRTIANVRDITGAIAENKDDISALIASARKGTDEFATLAEELRGLSGDYRKLATTATANVDQVGQTSVVTLQKAGAAADSLARTSAQLDGMLKEIRPPVRDFAQSSLYDLGQLIGEFRRLTLSLSRITKEFERDPAGYLLGPTQKGYKPQ